LGREILSEADAARAHDRLQEMGVTIRYEDGIAAYLSEDDLLLDRVQLASGDVIGCRMCISAIGVQPTTEFLEESGLTLDAVTHAVEVNAQLQTNDPDVFAAGNCASVNGYITRTWSESAAQGRIAALNMLGQLATYLPPAHEDIVPLILEPQTEQV
jgi:nitrite reductase (NADH) large subunit